MRYARRWYLLIYGSIFYVCPVVKIVQLEDVTHTRHIGCHRAVSEGDQYLCPLAYQFRLFFIFVAADSTFNKSHIDVLREFMYINDRAVHDVYFADQINYTFVDVEQGHVAS